MARRDDRRAIRHGWIDGPWRICARASVMLNGIDDNAQQNAQEEAHDD